MMRRLEPKGPYKFRWEIQSSSNPDLWYVVAMTDEGTWSCGCIGWTRHVPRKDCKHITLIKSEEPVDAEAMTRHRARVPQAPAQPSLPRMPKPAPAEVYFVRQTRRMIKVA